METTNKTQDYKTKQFLARKIEETAAIQRWNDNYCFNMFFNDFANLLNSVTKLGSFASKVSETVEKTMNPYGYKIAQVSKKQAWIIACAIVDNNIDYSKI